METCFLHHCSLTAPYATVGSNVESLLTEHSFLPHWASRNDVRSLLEILAAGKEACIKVSVKLAAGERYHLVHAMSALDPAAARAGDRVIVVAEEDITQQVREQEELVTQRVAAQLMVCRSCRRGIG